MKKRVLSFVLVLVMLTAVTSWMPVAASAASTTSGTCGANVYWSFGNGTLTISGSGKMNDYLVNGSPWKDFKNSISNVYIEYGVTSIGDFAFCECEYLKSVTIPDSVYSIGQGAFEDCESLRSISLPSYITEIKFATFAGCSSLTSITIPGSVAYIRDYAFCSCTSLIRVDMFGVKSIGQCAFSDCDNLSFVLMSQNMTRIGDYAFSNCKSLRNISLPENLKRIGQYAFAVCSGLTSIVIPNGVTEIDTGAFYRCSFNKVAFSGSESQWKCIDIGSNNDALYDATISFSDKGNDIPVSEIYIKANKSKLRVGEKIQAVAVCLPNNASNKTVTWSSNNTKVATVDAKGIVTAKDVGNAVITVKSNNGKTAGYVVTVHDRNIIDYGDYKYKFSNSRDSFGYSSGYKIPKERYMQLGYPKSVAKEKVSKWGGNCFGMSTSSVLFYKNILQEERYNPNVGTPYQFDSPDAGNGAFLSDKWEVKLRQMIELFQISQELEGFAREPFSASEITKELDSGNPVTLSIYGTNSATGKSGGHRVVIYGYVFSSASGIYTFKIYDCSNFVYELIYIDNSSFYFRYNNTSYNWHTLRGFNRVKTMSAMYNTLRTIGDNEVTLFSVENNQTYIHIFTGKEKLTLTNLSNQTATIANGEVTGDIEDISVIPSSYLAEEPTYTIILPTDTYTITGSGDEVVKTSFADDYMSASVTAKSSTPITISSDLKEISVDTNADEEYFIQYTTYDNIFDEMNLSGMAAGKVTSKLTDTDISISGANTLTASASVSESVVSASSENLADNNEITVKCEENDGGTTIQILSTDTELTEKTALPERLTVSEPVYDLESGNYAEGQVLNFTKDDETIIYYTTDGSIPSVDNGIIYSLPIEINKSMTVKAISTKYGYLDSEVIELNYILPEVDMPQADIGSGVYDNIITVELSTENYDDEIYYTLDGSNPLENGILYTVPINISEDTCLKAYTLRNGCISEISEYEYVVASKYPFYFSNSLTNQDGEIITPNNIADITKVKMTLSKLHTGEHTGVFLIGFYDVNNKLIYVNFKSATIGDEINEVEIDITDDVSSAYKMKVFAWKDLSNMQLMCEAMEERIITE